MRDKKALQELLALDRETLEMMSPKPFKPRTLDVIVSTYAPHLYSDQDLALIKKLSGLEQEHFSHVVPRKARNKRVTGKRCCQTEDMVEEKTESSQSEDMTEEEVINRVNKKLRKTKISKDATPSSPSSSSPSVDAPSSSVLSPPELPEEFKNRIRELNGTDTKFLMHKTLSNTDVEPNNNRLSMPVKKVECEFLSQAEKAVLDERESKKKLVGLEVTVIDPCLREFSLLLKKWDMKTTSTYNLVSAWNHIVSNNKLRRDHQLHIWSFRVENKLYFLLNKL